MANDWVLLADEGRARILELRKPGRDLEEVEELTDAAAHADEADLRRDAHGRRWGAITGRASNNTESASVDKLAQEADTFARRVAEHLLQARRSSKFETLRLAAAPKFLGLLRRHLHEEVRQAVVEEVDKDLVQEDRRALTQRFFPPPPPV